ncbi:ATPase [Betaproteobacteria bacterium]|nr:ATPase [Betaproteobacteria bacterium]
MLTDVTIEGLRGVGRVELGFVPDQRVHTLFGVNGVGKTKCLEALYLFLLASNKDFQNLSKNMWRSQNSWSVMARMRDVANDLAFEMPETEHFKLSQLFNFAALDRQKRTMPHSLPVIFLGAGHRADLGDEQSANSLLGSFEERRKAYFNKSVHALQSNHLSSLGMTGDVRRWFVMRAQSVNPYQKSKDNRQVEIDAVLSMLHAMEARIDPESLQVDAAGQVFLEVDGQARELGDLSSGFISLVKLMQSIVAGYAAFTNEVQLQRVQGIVLIDEIESHLHPEWQVKIIPCLKKLLPNTTFYVATHSPLVLTQLKDGEAYLLERGEDGVVRSRMIEGTSRRLLVDVLERAFGVDCNKLKFQAMEQDPEQNRKAKQGLLSLLDEVGSQV